MPLSDYAGGSKGASATLEVSIAPVDPIVATGRLLKAIKANDVEGAYDAFCLLYEAHRDTMAQPADDDGDY